MLIDAIFDMFNNEWFMETFMPITYLNDFIFCPYSLYLHQVFDQGDEIMYSAKPQQVGKAHHENIDGNELKCNFNKELRGIYVVSNKLGIYGKIDILEVGSGKLVERKYHISTIYQGYLYQIWSQYFALTEMGYTIKQICFYSIKDKRTYPLELPGVREFEELRGHIRRIARYDFDSFLKTNLQKCLRCIYAALCDKTETEHVYA